jgi:pyruvate/2-oxoglutarate dehydrogenase complex dihydrolipoamide dehydrogenase (E3) component
LRYDLVIVGMGSAGVTAAEFACQLGLRVAVVERHRIGGDCLWTGCVPSKALIAAAKVAATVRHAVDHGVHAGAPEVDLDAVWRRIHAVQAEIAATDDNPHRFERLGAEVVLGTARLAGPHEVAVGERTLRTRFVLLCTGSRPRLPAVAGLAEAGYLTSETVWDRPPPGSLAVLGGGPIGVELAQALTRLGVTVTLYQRGPSLLPREEPSLVARLTERLRAEGVDVRLGVDVTRADELAGEAVLVATGREPNVEELGLAGAGVRVGPRGIVVDDRSRTSVPSVYAVGDVTGGPLFTHVAAAAGALAVRDMFFPGRGRVMAPIPWCTFTDPELAHVGLTSADAAATLGRGVAVHRADLAHNDRARADGSIGEIVVVTHKGRVVGGHVLAPAAGEMVHELGLAVRQRLRLTELATLVHAYPTYSTSVGRIAGDAAYELGRRFGWLARWRAKGRSWRRWR